MCYIRRTRLVRLNGWFHYGCIHWATILPAIIRKKNHHFMKAFLRNWVFKYISTEAQTHGENLKLGFQEFLIHVFHLLQVWAGRISHPQRTQTKHCNFKPHSYAKLVQASQVAKKMSSLHGIQVKTSGSTVLDFLLGLECAFHWFASDFSCGHQNLMYLFA